MKDRGDEQEPMFESLDETAAALGWDAEMNEAIRLDMELTAPREPGETVH